MTLPACNKHFLNPLDGRVSLVLQRASKPRVDNGVRPETEAGHDRERSCTTSKAYIMSRKMVHSAQQRSSLADSFTDHLGHREAVEAPLAESANSDSSKVREWAAANKPTKTLLVDTQAVPRRQKKGSLRTDWWLYEIGWPVPSFICIVAIITVLYRFNDQPLSAWKMPIALNSRVSLFRPPQKLRYSSLSLHSSAN